VIGSLIVYSGLVLAFLGFLFLFIKRVRRLGIRIALAGVALLILGFALPAPESRSPRIESRLDEFVPVWQFSEHHEMRIAAPPARVYDAIKNVRADEIALFRTLTWIRRGGRKLPENILNAGNQRSLLDVATSSGFVYLADTPSEVVVGTAVIAPRGTRGKMTPEVFHMKLRPGFALAAMNFVVRADGAGSLVTTETRVFANSPRAKRNFRIYWRIIYPGSALIRRMWLRAIARRATSTHHVAQTLLSVRPA